MSRGSLSSKQHKIAYSVIGATSLIVWFNVFFQYNNSIHPDNGPMIVFWGVLFYLFFYSWLYSLAKIVFPRFALQFSLGLSAVFFLLDILVPPYYVTPNGEIITAGATFTFGASDVLLAEFLSGLGVHGPILWWLVYIVIPITVLFILVPIFWSTKKIATTLGRGG